MKVFTWILISPCEEIKGQWIGHALEFDIVSMGNSAPEACDMVVDALKMIVEHDLGRGKDPYLERRKAPATEWDKLHAVLTDGVWEDPAPSLDYQGGPAHLVLGLWLTVGEGELEGRRRFSFSECILPFDKMVRKPFS